MQTVTELLGESKRKIVYLVYGLIGVGFGATQTAFLTAEVEAPLWFTVALAVYSYVGVAFGLVAAQNVGSQEVVVSPYNPAESPEDVEDVSSASGKHAQVEGYDLVFDGEIEIPLVDEDLR